ncbi:MAG: hypothetical protein WCI22_17520 [Actinomycetota bacterium]
MESGNVAWVLVSAALVLFMTPGLAFFDGGMDRPRHVLNMLMMNFHCVLVIPLLWVVIGYSPSQVPFDNSFGGGPRLLFEQFLANMSAILWSFVLTFAIMKVLQRTIGARVDPEDEMTGLDLALHSETAYHGGGQY